MNDQKKSSLISGVFVSFGEHPSFRQHWMMFSTDETFEASTVNKLRKGIIEDAWRLQALHLSNHMTKIVKSRLLIITLSFVFLSLVPS